MIKNRLLVIIYLLLGAILVPNNSYCQHASDSITIKDLNSYNSYFNKLLSDKEYEILKEESLLLCNQLKEREDINKSIYATALYYLSAASAKLSEYEFAIKYGLEVVELYKEQKWNTNYGLALTCAVISDSYSNLKDYHNAISWGEQSLHHKKTVYQNRETLDISLTYGKLSAYYFRINQKEKALEYAEHNLRIKRLFLEPNHKDCIVSAARLCLFYYDLQNYSNAINLAKEYVCEKVKVENIDAYLNFCAVLSHSYDAIGYNSLSIQYAQEGYKVFKQQNKGSFNPNLINYIGHLPLSRQINIEESILKKQGKHRRTEFYCSLQQNLAGHYFESNNIDKAIELQLECINNRKLISEGDSAKYCESLNHLVHYYLAKEDSINFHKYQEESTNITKRIFGEESYEYTDLLRTKYWGSLLWEKYESIVILEELLNTYKKLLNRDFMLLTYSEKFNLWNTINDYFYDEYISLYLQTIYNGALDIEKYNSNLYDNVLFYKELILDSQLEDLCLEYNNRVLGEPLVDNDLILTKLGNHINYKWDDVQNKLDSTSIAIEFMEVGSKELIALIVSVSLNFPHLVYICSIEDLNHYEKDYFNIDFTQLIWENIVPYCTNVNDIYISLDGYINNFAIENLPIREVFNKDFNIYRLSSTRKLVEMEFLPNRECSRMFLYGGLDYGKKTNGQYENLFQWEKLPETLNEIIYISKIAKTNGYETHVHSGSEGTETSVRQLSSLDASIIHFATHSFYFEEQHYIETPSLIKLANENKTTNDISLIRSGLLFSNINSVNLYEIADNPFDGILTSYEIAELDLNNTDLVVLSTCQSALGEISKEGVFGLQRAFREAGAHSILMSLWNVDDYSTQLLMTEFYRHYLSGTSKLESLKKAQRYVREYEDEEGNRLFEDPSYWAGFILLDALD